ncbi:molybdopterin biosynthesis protein [Chloroflexota bacterium]
MTIYLHDIPLPEARKRFESVLISAGLWDLLEAEEIPLDQNAILRVLAEPVWAKTSSPHYHSAAMDGFAVHSGDTIGALATQPVLLKYGGYDEIHKTVYIDTGDPLPEWADAVIPIENVEPLDDHGHPVKDQRHPVAIRIRAAVTPWSHVRVIGEDIIATQLVLPAGHTLRPVDLGAIAACGHESVRVARKPRVAIIPTGSELLPIGSQARSGEIIEYNSLVLASQVRLWGGEATRMPITPDVFEDIKKCVEEASQKHDLVLLNAGSSAGSEDYSARVIETLGELVVHGIAVRPGHPTILGMIDLHNEDTSRKIPIIGVPGYPVSAALTGELFMEPLITKWLGRTQSEPGQVTATLTRKVTSPAGDDDYMRVVVGRVGKKILAAPLSRGAGVITSLVRADGIAVIPRGTQGLPAGESIRVNLFRPFTELENVIFAIGSHDMTLDIMAQFLAQYDRRLTSANVGSLGGLVALSRDEAHVAGSHLLDPDSGEYNISYVEQYLPGRKVKIVNLVGRQQGLLVQKDNPKRIETLEDLTRSDVKYVNRQRGAGTRVLLDYNLDKLGIATDVISGYQHEEFSHLSVAAVVSSKRADCGLGIAASAEALDLGFIPLYQERYDLIIPAEFFADDLLSPMLELLATSEFQQAVLSLPGYDVSIMGSLIAELG